VIDSRQSDEIALIRYDIRNTEGSMDVRYWSATHTPILDAQGDVEFILQHTVDVTEIQSLRLLRDEGVIERANAVEARNRNLAEERNQLKALLEEAPGFVAVLDGPAIYSAWPIAPIEILWDKDFSSAKVLPRRCRRWSSKVSPRCSTA
jgi:hypothetical protein